jgi:DNA modification methylase
VLDPFAGTGTTLLAAVRRHRRAIGIELEPRFCLVAEQRIGVGRP